MITRKEYMDAAGSKTSREMHRAYYGQFVTEDIKRLVRARISTQRLCASKDPHLNDIPLKEWDSVMPLVPKILADSIRSAGDFPTQAGIVCILKEAARQIIYPRKNFKEVEEDA